MTADEQTGMGWWNALTEEQRAHWLAQAKTAILAHPLKKVQFGAKCYFKWHVGLFP
jgi:hypothetical protein